MPDWPHQIRGVQETVARLQVGVPSMCLTSPTGGGKSLMIQRLCEWAVRRRSGVTVLTNRRLLTAQLAEKLNQGGIHVGVRAADFESWTDFNAPVQICSIQTEMSRVFERRRQAVEQGMDPGVAERQWSLHKCGLLIVDEVHLNKADSVQQMIEEYRRRYQTQVVGVTATPLGISHICSELIVAGNNSELRASGALVAAKCYEPCLFDLPKIRRSKTGLFTQQEMNEQVKAIWSQHIVGHVYAHWKRLNPHTLPSLGMAPGRKESLGLAMEFHKHGVNAAHICSQHIFVDGKLYTTTEQKDRDELFARSQAGEIPMIWNRFVLREAVDLPWLEHLVLATPIASLLSYVQVVGRVLRASPSTGKRYATISDHGGAFRLHGSPNLDRDQDWRDYFFQDAKQITKDRVDRLTDPERKEPEPIVCPQCQAMRKSGAQCPECGFQHQASVRLVIQETGKLRRVRGDFYPKRRVETRSDTEKLWEKTYWRCRNAKRPMTFRQALALFKKENGYEPPRDIAFMPAEKLDINRQIRAVAHSRLVRGTQAEKSKQSAPAERRKTLFD